MASLDRSRSPLRLTSLPDPIRKRVTKDAAIMILQEDFAKASTLAMTAADRMDLVQGMRSPRESDAPVKLEERNAWQAHFHLGTPDPLQAMPLSVPFIRLQHHRGSWWEDMLEITAERSSGSAK